MDIVDLVLVAAGALLFLVSRDTRTLRAGGFLVVLGAAILLARGLPQPWQGVVKASAVWSYVVVFLCFQHLLAGRSAAEARIDRQLRRIAAEAGAKACNWPADDEQARASRDFILGKIAALEAPNQDWAHVVTLCHAYYGQLLMPPDGGSAASTNFDSSSATRNLDQMRSDLSVAWEEALRPGRREPP